MIKKGRMMEINRTIKDIHMLINDHNSVIQNDKVQPIMENVRKYDK